MTPDRRPAGPAPAGRSSETPSRHERIRTGGRRAAGAARTRFAPAPTGYLHLGHVANAIFVWGTGRARRERPCCCGSRTTIGRAAGPSSTPALLEDLAWLGFVPDEGPVRQSRRRRAVRGRARSTPRRRPRLRLRLLADDVRGVGREHGRRWHGAGLPGRLPRARARRPDAAGRRSVAAASAGWTRSSGRARTRWRPAATRPSATATGNWTYGFCGRRRRPPPGRRPRRPRARPARRDARPDPARRACSGARRRRRFAHHPLVRRAGRPQAVEGRRRHVGPRPARGRPLARGRSSARRPPRSG